jgi:hypothetical protein
MTMAPRPRPARALRVLLALLAGVASSALADAGAEMAAFRAHVVAELRALDFRALDAEADAYRASGARFADGRWKLSLLFATTGGALPDLVLDDARRRALEASTAAYAKAHPASANAGLFRVQVLEAEAWAARGKGDRASVAPDGQRRFEATMIEARHLLDAGRAAMDTNPVWYVERLSLSTYTGEDPAWAEALMREGLARSPRFHAIYYAGLVARTPSWGGSAAKMMAWINETGHASDAARAEGMYARLVWTAQDDDERIEDDPALDWPAMMAAFDAILHAWPDQRNVQKFFMMACRHADKPLAARLLPRVREPLLPDIVDADDQPAFRQCADWARGRIPQFTMRDKVIR